MLSWLHIGDLHLTEAGCESHRDLQRIVTLAGGLPPGSLDFALLPGDNADNGTPEQFRLVRDAVAGLALPLHILPGDHDFEPGSLDAYHAVLGARRLPWSTNIKGTRCLFLDVVSRGSGGPDFRLDDPALDWIEREIDTAEGAVAVFMHTYPADLRAGSARLAALLARPGVLCVDMGHTHYNELANDGGTIFMATRSTGQIEEGPAGFSVAALDGRCVSWRFKPLDMAWPFVLVTHPADRRLVTDADQIVAGSCLVRAKVLGDAAIESVSFRPDDAPWQAMTKQPGEVAVWQAPCPRAAVIRVRARDARGRVDETCIEPAGPAWTRSERRVADGSDRHRIEPWPEQGIPGGQLGPNRNGRKW